MTEFIWTTAHAAIFAYDDGMPVMLPGVTLHSIEKKSVSVCPSCGQDDSPTLGPCQHCGAPSRTRIVTGASELFGAVIAKFMGYMPRSSWLLHPPSIIEIHYPDHHRVREYDNWLGRIILRDCRLGDAVFDWVTYLERDEATILNAYIYASMAIENRETITP